MEDEEDFRRMSVHENDMKHSIDVHRRSNFSPMRVGPSERTIDELHKTQQDSEVQVFSAATFNDVKLGSEPTAQERVRRSLFPSYN